MTRSYQMLQLALLLLLLTACPSADPSLDSQFSPDSGTASLSWDASAGTDVAGYKIYLATASGAYGTPITTTPADVTTYTVTGLAIGTTYFFVVSAFNTDGTESTFSNEVSKMIP
ncbi:MAG: fibronectin type III domain-containing protein [Nitrospira sp.]|nr:fibronectin type III domain-containing protein [Nitrospira sp.]